MSRSDFMGRPKKEKPNHATGMYEVKVTVGHTFDGKPVRKSFYSSVSKAAAKAKAEEYKINQAVAEETGETFVPNRLTFTKAAQKWLESIKPTLSDSAYNNYEVAIRLHLEPFFKNALISNIKAIDIQNYFNKLSVNTPLESMKKYKNCLNGIFKMAVDNDYCTKNPCENVKLISSVENSEKQTYTKRQAYLISRYARTHKDGLGILLMLEYGLRKGELLGLQTGDIDFKNGTLHIQRSVADVKNKDTGKIEVKIKPPKNRQSDREIPLKKVTLNRLKNIKDGYIIPNAKGGVYSPSNWTKRNYKNFMEDMQEHYSKFGIDIPVLNPHELRHTRATIWVNEGKNLFAVAAVLGHSDLKMLQQRYAHKDTNSIRNLLDL